MRELEAQVYPEKLRELASNIAAQYKHGQSKQQMKEEAVPPRPTQLGSASDKMHRVQVVEASAYGKVGRQGFPMVQAYAKQSQENELGVGKMHCSKDCSAITHIVRKKII